MSTHISIHEMVQRLKPLAAHYGISFREMPAREPWPENSGISVAPFNSNLGIQLPKTLLYEDPAPATGLIHEMGHLLFGIKEEEYRWLGWEWTVARLLEVEEQWLDESADYVVFENGVDIELSWVEDLPRLYEERVAAAAKEGISLPSAELVR